MTDEEFSEKIMRILESDNDNGQAAKSHLAAGRPIYCPAGMIREWTDERRELAAIAFDGTIPIVKTAAEGA